MTGAGPLARGAALVAMLALRTAAAAQAPGSGDPATSSPVAAPAPPAGIARVRCPPGTQPAELGSDETPSGESAGPPSPPTIVCVRVGNAAPAARAPAAGGSAPSPVAPATPPPATPPRAAPGAPPPTPAEEEEARAAAERALERALVQKGGLVVRPGGVEIVPEIGFSYGDSAAPRGANLDVGAGARSEIFTGTLTLRVGLPLHMQVEARAPFVFARLTPGDDSPDGPAEGSGVGDVRVGLTWHLLRNRARLPDLLVGGFWKSRSGRTAFDDPAQRVPLGTGVEQFGGTLAIVKAVDPVVLLATGMYAVGVPRWIPQGWLEAGDQFGGSAGAVLAVSPETSLSFSLDASHARPFQLDQVTVYRSDQTSAVFRVGVATAASRRSLVQVNLGIGLTADVPRFEVSLATPFQF